MLLCSNVHKIQDASSLNKFNQIMLVCYLHNNHKDRDVLGQAEWSTEVAHQGHQEVENGHKVLCMDTWKHIIQNQGSLFFMQVLSVM